MPEERTCDQCSETWNSEHWKVCEEPKPEWMRKRIRYGLVPGHIPMSYSTMSTYDECARRLKLQREVGLRDNSPAIVVGRDFHAAAEARYLGEPVPIPKAPLSVWTDSLAAQAQATGMALDLKDLVGTEHNGGELEWVFEVMASDGSMATVHFVCVIDRLHIAADGRVHTVDYKTGWYVPKLVDDDPQGLTYAVIVHENFPETWEFSFSQYQTRFDETKSVTFDLDKVLRFRDYLIAHVQAIVLDEQMKPNPGDQCRRCIFALNHCKAGQQMVGDLGPALDAEGLQRYAAAVIAGEANLNTLRDSLKSAMDVLGIDQVELPTGSYTIAKTTGRYGPYAKLNWAARKDENRRTRWERRKDTEGVA